MGLDNHLGPETCSDTLTSLLEEKAAEIAVGLNLPIGFDGRPFILPAGPAILCRIERETARAAALGSDAPLRVDGTLKMAVSGLSQDRAIHDTAEAVASRIPKGFGLEYAGTLGSGELVFATPQILEPKSDAGRISIEVSFGFYAIIFPGE